MIEISRTNINFEREAFVSPFGFKGGYLSEGWQCVALMESFSGHSGLGLSNQGVLWSDARVFSENLEPSANAIMFLMTAHALKLARGTTFESPFDLLDHLLPDTHDYGRRISGRKDLRLTFALNALVALDNAAWQLYCSENGIASFDQMIPASVRPALSHRHCELASIPLITYGVSIAEIVRTIDNGCFFLKIKIGSDPDGDGDPDKMLEWDKNRLSEIHDAVRDRRTPCTEDGRVPYYLDANGRYDCKERLLRLLDHADRIGALDRIVILEEPFPEEYKADVSDVPVRIAADESAHSDRDASERIDLGYGAIALKPIAKTMSMSLRIAQIAHERGTPCFCADLTVNPILVDWNKNVACRLAPLPGMRIGVLETNGHQNYANWESMRGYHPCFGAPWMDTVNGLFRIDDDFHARSGGILEQSEHYLSLVRQREQ